MNKHTTIHLTADERQHLQTLLHRGVHSAKEMTRARILLLADRSQGKRHSDAFIAHALACHKNTVGNIRRRFGKEGLQSALQDKARPGPEPSKLTGEVEAALTLLACSAPPQGHARWTVRLLAERMVALEYVDSLSKESVRLALKKTRSHPGGSSAGASASRPPSLSPRWKTS